MKCPHCGEDLPENYEEIFFCPSCGNRLSEEVNEQSQEAARNVSDEEFADEAKDNQSPSSLENAKTVEELKAFQEEQIRLAQQELEERKARRAERERQAKEERIRLSKLAPEWWELESDDGDELENTEQQESETVSKQPEHKSLTKREEEEAKQKKISRRNRMFTGLAVVIAALTVVVVVLSTGYSKRLSTQSISVSDEVVTGTENAASADIIASESAIGAVEDQAAGTTSVSEDASAASEKQSEEAGSSIISSAEVTDANPTVSAAESAENAESAGAESAAAEAETAENVVTVFYPVSFEVSNQGFDNAEAGIQDTDNVRTDTFVVTNGFFSYEAGEEDPYLFNDDEMAERAFFTAEDYQHPEVLIGGDIAMAYCEAVLTGKMTGRYMPGSTDFYELDWANRLSVLQSGTGLDHTETVSRGEFIYQENGAISKVVYTYEGSDETNSVDFTYDEADRLIYVGDREIVYDSETGRVSRMNRNGRVEKEFTYNEAGVIATEIEHFYGEDGTESGTTTFSYNFDENGRLTNLRADNYALMGGSDVYVFTYGEI